MILGTHNSLTYAKPTTWLGKLLNKTAQCQELSIIEQYNYGVRYFDIRINRNTPYNRHGLVTYDVKVEEALRILNDMSTQVDPIYVSLNYENGLFEPKSKYEQWFKEAYSSIVSNYRNLVFTGGYAKHPWRRVIDVPRISILEMHWEFGNFKYGKTTKDKIRALLQSIIHFNPRYWAEKNNSTYRKWYEDTNLMLDFVNV